MSNAAPAGGKATPHNLPVEFVEHAFWLVFTFACLVGSELLRGNLRAARHLAAEYQLSRCAPWAAAAAASTAAALLGVCTAHLCEDHRPIRHAADAVKLLWSAVVNLCGLYVSYTAARAALLALGINPQTLGCIVASTLWAAVAVGGRFVLLLGFAVHVATVATAVALALWWSPAVPWGRGRCRRTSNDAATGAKAANGANQRTDHKQFLSWYICDAGKQGRSCVCVCVRMCVCVCVFVCALVSV
jgi:hypothetical protein